jgi:A/G-specific adenine glycosylase
MGYNNRATRLHELARTVVREHGGTLVPDGRILTQLPGIGRYTANALLCFSFGRRVPVVDVNVRRVLSRVLRKMPTMSALLDEDSVWKAALSLLPSRRAFDWNQALMDLGATVCVARAPSCKSCPITSVCSSSARM